MKKVTLLFALFIGCIACNSPAAENKDATEGNTETTETTKETPKEEAATISKERQAFANKFPEVASLNDLLKKEVSESLREVYDEIKDWKEAEEEAVTSPYSPAIGLSAFGKTSSGKFWLMMAEYSTPRAVGVTLFAMNKKTGEVTGGLHYSNGSVGPDGSSYTLDTKVEGNSFRQTEKDIDPAGKEKSKKETTYTFDPEKGTFSK
jgi:hypothetical protein